MSSQIHFSRSFPRSSLSLRFLRKYQTNQVMMKIGSTSAPGTNSSKDIIPTNLNMSKQAMVPKMSSRSPTTGMIKIVTTYSLMSNNMQTMSESNSSSVNKKYRGALNFFSCSKLQQILNNTSFTQNTYLNGVKHIFILITRSCLTLCRKGGDT